MNALLLWSLALEVELTTSLFTREHGFTFVRLDGSINQKKRTEVIREFQSSAADSPTIMLLSLKAGGVGLNLTAASHVLLMDPVSLDCSNTVPFLQMDQASSVSDLLFQAWNPATEEQCIDRCHRLGQTRKVTVTKVRKALKPSSLQFLQSNLQTINIVFMFCSSLSKIQWRRGWWRSRGRNKT